MNKHINKDDYILYSKNLSFSYEKKKIFQDVSMYFERNKITAIVGPSGVGKTTILKLLTGQIVPTNGLVYFNGLNITSFKRKELYSVRRKMSILFQSNALFTDLNVFDNVAFPLRELSSLDEITIKDRVEQTLGSVGLMGSESLMPSELSGGMARRVAFCRSIINEPEVILFDEPFVGQDPISKGVLTKLIETLPEKKITAVLVSHDIPETLHLADYAYVLYNAKIAEEGPKEKIVSSSSELVQQFIQGLPDGPIKFNYAKSDS